MLNDLPGYGLTRSSSDCGAIVCRRLPLFLPVCQRERKYIYESFRTDPKCAELGATQDAHFGAPAHVCHVWRHGAGANFGPELRTAPVHPNDAVVCRNWHVVFSCLYEAEGSCFFGLLFRLFGWLPGSGQPEFRDLRQYDRGGEAAVRPGRYCGGWPFVCGSGGGY